VPGGVDHPHDAEVANEVDGQPDPRLDRPDGEEPERDEEHLDGDDEDPWGGGRVGGQPPLRHDEQIGGADQHQERVALEW